MRSLLHILPAEITKLRQRAEQEGGQLSPTLSFQASPAPRHQVPPVLLLFKINLSFLKAPLVNHQFLMCPSTPDHLGPTKMSPREGIPAHTRPPGRTLSHTRIINPHPSTRDCGALHPPGLELPCRSQIPLRNFPSYSSNISPTDWELYIPLP